MIMCSTSLVVRSFFLKRLGEDVKRRTTCTLSGKFHHFERSASLIVASQHKIKSIMSVANIQLQFMFSVLYICSKVSNSRDRKGMHQGSSRLDHPSKQKILSRDLVVWTWAPAGL